jgi:hypothetical protein
MRKVRFYNSAKHLRYVPGSKWINERGISIRDQSDWYMLRRLLKVLKKGEFRFSGWELCFLEDWKGRRKRRMTLRQSDKVHEIYKRCFGEQAPIMDQE